MHFPVVVFRANKPDTLVVWHIRGMAGMKMDFSRLKRPKHPMPGFVTKALIEKN
jgi:hypothetical protein